MSHEGYVLGHFSYYLFVFCISFVFDLIYFTKETALSESQLF